jgi:hypothetical protein
MSYHIPSGVAPEKIEKRWSYDWRVALYVRSVSGSCWLGNVLLLICNATRSSALNPVTENPRMKHASRTNIVQVVEVAAYITHLRRKHQTKRVDMGARARSGAIINGSL